MTAAPSTETTGAVSRLASPYVGLVPFEEADAAFFFGRSTEAAIVAANLRAAPLTILYGPSGVGKSSLLMAGAVHLLREESREADDEDRFAVCAYRSWRDDPLRGVQEAARAAFEEATGGRALPAAQETLAETLRAWTESNGTLLLVFDQFEEYFQYHPDEGADSNGFAAELARIVNDASLDVNVLLSIREDAWAKLDAFKGRIPSLFANYLRVGHLAREAAREAIEGPINAWNEGLPDGERYSIEKGLTDAVLDAASGGDLTLGGDAEAPDMIRDRRDGTAVDTPDGPVEAPFLQLVLDRLWRATLENGDRTLTEARLEALGGARTIVENHLLDALGRLSPAEQDTASACFQFLVSSSRTKIAHPPAALADFTERPEPEVTAVLDKLSSAEGGRILRREAPATDEGSPTYELFHDVLAEPILAWRTAHEAERRRRAFRRRVIRIGSVLLVLVALFASLAVLALVQRQRAKSAGAHARNEANQATSLLLASPAEKNVENHLDRALLVALEANRFAPTSEARNAMTLALQYARTNGLDRIIDTGAKTPVESIALSPDGKTLATGGDRVRLWDVASGKPLDTHLTGAARPPLGNSAEVNSVVSVAFSPKRNRLAASWLDGSVRVWDLASPEPHGRNLTNACGCDAILNVAFSPDGTTLAGGVAGSVRLWDLAAPGSRGKRLIGGGDTSSVAFSPDGKSLATVGPKGAVQLWDPGRREQLGKPIPGGGAGVDSIAFLSNGKLMGREGNGQVRVWDLRRRKSTPFGLDYPFASLAVGPHGALAFGDRDDPNFPPRAGQVTPLYTQGPVALLSGSSSVVDSLAFSPDGKMLAAGGDDGKVRVWNLASLFGAPLKGSDRAGGITVSPDGRKLAAVSEDGKVLLWSLASGSQLRVPLAGGDSTSAASVSFSPDGETVAAGGKDGKVRLWDVRSGKLRTPALTGGKDPLLNVAFAPDGETLVAGDKNGKVWQWNLSSGKLTGPPLSGSAMGPFTSSYVLSPDGKTLAVSGADVNAGPGAGGAPTANVRLWDLGSRKLVGTLVPGGGYASALTDVVAFSPDGKLLATGDSDGSNERVRLWDLPHPQRRPTTLDATGAVSSLAFSPDGKTLAGVVDVKDGEVQLWDLASLKPLGTPFSGSDNLPVASVAFTPDGKTLVGIGSRSLFTTARRYGQVVTWKGLVWTDAQNLQDQVCGLVRGNLTPAEWASVAPPDLAYRRICPD